MARPKTGNTVRNVALTLSAQTLGPARRSAFERGWSLSELVDRLLVAELLAPTSLAADSRRISKATAPKQKGKPVTKAAQ
jgi:hypothetical protein